MSELYKMQFSNLIEYYQYWPYKAHCFYTLYLFIYNVYSIFLKYFILFLTLNQQLHSIIKEN